LAKELAVNATVLLGGGSAATCTASFQAGFPDLVVTAADWTDANTASVTIRNANPWIGVPATVTRVSSNSCMQGLVKSVDVPTAAIAKGATLTVTAALPKPTTPGAFFVAGWADATTLVHESSEVNNVYANSNICGPKG
jgi:hypothetical protein